jgi:regulator-associated protein of mTOR
VSGTIAGDVLFWDLRLPEPLRSIEIQRSAMTALSCHPRIPILASGSHDFLKISSADGDTLQAFRHHNKLQERRIDPVSTLTFHPNATLLAAGFKNNIISIYGT